MSATIAQHVATYFEGEKNAGMLIATMRLCTRRAMCAHKHWDPRRQRRNGCLGIIGLHHRPHFGVIGK